MENLGKPCILRIFYKFSQLHPAVNTFDEDLGLTLVNMTYTKERLQSTSAAPWFVSKINGGLRTIAQKKGKPLPAAVCATTSNAIVDWSDSE